MRIRILQCLHTHDAKEKRASKRKDGRSGSHEVRVKANIIGDSPLLLADKV